MLPVDVKSPALFRYDEVPLAGKTFRLDDTFEGRHAVERTEEIPVGRRCPQALSDPVDIGHFPLIRGQHAQLAGINKSRELSEQVVKLGANLRIPWVSVTALAQPIQVHATVLKLEHLVAVTIADLQTRSGVLCQLKAQRLSPLGFRREAFFLPRQGRHILNRRQSSTPNACQKAPGWALVNPERHRSEGDGNWSRGSSCSMGPDVVSRL